MFCQYHVMKFPLLDYYETKIVLTNTSTNSELEEFYLVTPGNNCYMTFVWQKKKKNWSVKVVNFLHLQPVTPRHVLLHMRYFI